MKQYFLNGKLIEKPKSIKIDGKYIFNPSDKTLIKHGYEIKEYVQEHDTNESIKIKRQIAYENRTDKYLIAYQAYKELGETEKAIDMKTLWLEERKKIDEEYPYLNE